MRRDSGIRYLMDYGKASDFMGRYRGAVSRVRASLGLRHQKWRGYLRKFLGPRNAPASVKSLRSRENLSE